MCRTNKEFAEKCKKIVDQIRDIFPKGDPSLIEIQQKNKKHKSGGGSTGPR